MRKTITKRVADIKGHTKAFIVNNNERLTRGQVAKLARNGKVTNAVARKGPYGWYVQAPAGAERTLYDLPTIVK